MKYYSFLISFLTGTLRTLKEELRYSCTIFAPESKTPSARTISAPAPKLTARLAGRSEASEHQNRTGFQKEPSPHFSYFNRKGKIEPFMNRLVLRTMNLDKEVKTVKKKIGIFPNSLYSNPLNEFYRTGGGKIMVNFRSNSGKISVNFCLTSGKMDFF